MIKSKRKTLVYARELSPATWKIDSAHDWNYQGESKKKGTKYRSNNIFVNSNSYAVIKSNIQGKDLADV